jgi:HSP20 family molecular chaperone IbpA
MSTEMVKKDEEALENVSERPSVRPPVDIYENREEYLVVADLPGVNSDNLDINLDADRLTLTGKTVSDTPGEVVEREYRMFDYARTFQLPNVVDREKVSAELRNGVLTLHLPKVDAVKPRRIEVKAG